MSLFDTGIRPAVDKWLLDKAAEQRDYGSYWSASSAGYCMRKVIFDRLGVKPVENGSEARKQRVFTSGHLFHDWLQSITKEAGLSIASEVELQDDRIMVRGHFDDLIEFVYGDDKEQSHKILYDYKTVHSQSFKYKTDKASHYHTMQLGTYMYMLRHNYPELEEARVLNISKDDLRMMEQQVLWTPQLEKQVYEYWSTLNGYWKSKKLPKCTCEDHEGGFMAKEKWNPYFYDGEPCSVKWYNKWKEKQSEDTRPSN